MKLEADSGGRGDRLIVLLHGLGTTREVWEGFTRVLDKEWEGRWIAPDLRGHGRSRRAASYGLGNHAADVAELVEDLAPARSEVFVLGHSMGGVVALALASGWFGWTPKAAFGLGIKINWTPQELAKLKARAAAPPKKFENVEDAVAFYLMVSGLRDIVSPDSPTARAGVVRTEEGVMLASDPATGKVGAPPMEALVAASQAPVRLAAGALDAMSPLAHMQHHDEQAVALKTVGHNAMVEAPDRVWEWVWSLL
jgi:pimeloyl-ACP methyl ester carboxylesterase